jgi:hypothetical protein
MLKIKLRREGREEKIERKIHQKHIGASMTT